MTARASVAASPLRRPNVPPALADLAERRSCPEAVLLDVRRSGGAFSVALSVGGREVFLVVNERGEQVRRPGWPAAFGTRPNEALADLWPIEEAEA